MLRAIFNHDAHFEVHQALPQVAMFGDEGAANHNRLGGDYGDPACSCLSTGEMRGATPRNPLSCSSDAGGQPGGCAPETRSILPRVFAQQNPHVIDQGVFHIRRDCRF